MNALALGGMIAGLALATHWLDARRHARPNVLWTRGWLFWFASASLVTLGGDVSWSVCATRLVGPYFPALMLAGTLVYSGRSVPHWLLPAAFVAGVARCGLFVAGYPNLEPVVALLLEPTALLAAAVLAFRAAGHASRLKSRLWLAPSLLALAVLEATGTFEMIAGTGPSTAHHVSWALAGLFAIFVQIHISRDTTLNWERRVAQVISETEERYRALTENSFDLITEMDSSGRFLYLNGRCEEWFGRPREDLIGTDAVDLVHPDDRRRMRRWFAARPTTDGVRLITIRVPKRDGGCRWVEISGRTFHHGDELRFAANSRDITERFELSAELQRVNEKLEERVERRNAQLQAAVENLELQVAERLRVENELRISEERWRNVSELSSDMSFATTRTADGVLRADWITHAISRLTGHDMHDLARIGWKTFVHPDDVDLVRENLTGILPGETREYVVRVKTPTGVRRWLRTRIVCKPTDTPGTVKILGAGRDITEAREAAAAQRRLDSHIQETQKLESLGVLAGGVAHDFNNALAVILGNAALALADTEPGSRTAQQLERIRTAGKHAEALTRQMLTYSGKATVSLKPLDLRRLIDDMSDLLEAATPKSCQLDITALMGRTRIAGDPTQLQQVVMNLVTNAAEAVGDTPSRIKIRTGAMFANAEYLEDTFGSNGMEPGRYVFLDVSDPGKGIGGDIRNRVFEPFFSTKFTGRGLGLASVLGIVRGHRGAIHLTTEPGTGTRFRVLFPPAAEDTQTERDALAPDAESATSGQVLVIDDDEAVLEVASEFLSRSGLAVLKADGGRKALEILRNDTDARIHSVVLDLSMPDLDGVDTLAEIRRLRPNLPVVIASGYGEEVTDTRFPSGDINAFLRKPYSPEELIEAVLNSTSG